MTDAICQPITWLERAVCLMESHPVTTETVVSAAAAVVAVVSAAVAVCALLHAARSFRESVNNLHYTELDNTYLELLKMAIDKPYLRRPDAIYRNPSEHEYDIYARMIWNFLEAVADRCDNDPKLEDTWHPVIRDEGFVHKQWIRMNPKGYGKRFYERFGPDGKFGDEFLKGAQGAKRVRCPPRRRGAGCFFGVCAPAQGVVDKAQGTRHAVESKWAP